MTREEAINEIKSWDFLEGKEIEAIHTLIPELKESEDERIRRKMIEHFKAKTKDTWCNMPVKDIIAYLEKQKVFSNGEGLYYYRPDGDCTFIGTGLGPIEDIKLNGERPKTENKSVDLPGSVKINGCVEKQKEPHKRLRDKTPWIVTAKEELAHAEERLQANLEELHRIRAEKEKQKEQKPAWSEEDEEMLDIVLTMVDCSTIVPHSGGQLHPSESYKKDISEWLKSLRPRLSDEEIKKIRSEEYTKGFNDAAFGGKLKEWSMEDEDRIRQIERIAQQAGCTQKLQEEIHAWLKSLRPSWKPSEEQK